MFLRKSCCFFIVFCLMSLNCFPIETFQLLRVAVPSKDQINQEKNSLYQRECKRYMVKMGTTASVLVMMYVAYKASEYFKDMDKHLDKVDQRVAGLEKGAGFQLKDNILEKKEIVEQEVKVAQASGLAPIRLAVGGVKACVVGAKDFVAGCGKCFIESCPTFITGMVLSTLWQQVCNRVIEASKQETISWYIENHTQLWPLFHDISLGCVPYDLHGELLSLQQAHDKAGLCVQSYADELSALVQDNKEDCVGDGYFQYSCDELKKNYAKKGSELVQLQNYAAPNIAKRKRAINQGFEDVSLFQSDEIGKQNLVDLMNVLTVQIQKVVSFAMMHINKHRSGLSKESIARGEKRVAQMINSTNRYLEQMEQLLNMDNEHMEGMSIANRGMFTCTYEFERLFREQINILHRYCSLIR